MVGVFYIMSLLKHPVGKSSELGIEALGELPYEPSDPKNPMLTYASMKMYMACNVALVNGNRGLMPLVWAWSASAIYNKLSGLSDKNNIVKDLLDKVEDTIFDFGINPEVDSLAGGTVNFLGLIVRIREGGYKGRDMGKALNNSDLHLDEKRLLILVAKYASLGGTIVDGASAAYVSEPNEEGRNPEKPDLSSAMENVRAMSGNSFANLVRGSYKVCYALKESYPGNAKVWDLCASIVCKMSDDVSLPKPSEDETSYACRNRRWRSGSITDNQADDRDYYESILIHSVRSNLEVGLKNTVDNATPLQVLRAFDFCREYILTEWESFIPVSFMRREAYDSFVKEGQTKTLYDLDDEGVISDYHYQYSDIPLHTRKINDKRLWGEEGRFITYGSLIHLGMSDVIEYMKSMFGRVMIEWDRSVLDYSTATINDCALAPYTFPSTFDNCAKLLIPFVMARVNGGSKTKPGGIVSVVKSVTGGRGWPSYVELQIHDLMTTDRVKSVDI